MVTWNDLTTDERGILLSALDTKLYCTDDQLVGRLSYKGLLTNVHDDFNDVYYYTTSDKGRTVLAQGVQPPAATAPDVDAAAGESLSTQLLNTTSEDLDEAQDRIADLETENEALRKQVQELVAEREISREMFLLETRKANLVRQQLGNLLFNMKQFQNSGQQIGQERTINSIEAVMDSVGWDKS